MLRFMTLKQIFFSQDSTPGICFPQLLLESTKKDMTTLIWQKTRVENFNQIKMPPILVVFK